MTTQHKSLAECGMQEPTKRTPAALRKHRLEHARRCGCRLCSMAHLGVPLTWEEHAARMGPGYEGPDESPWQLGDFETRSRQPMQPCAIISKAEREEQLARHIARVAWAEAVRSLKYALRHGEEGCLHGGVPPTVPDMSEHEWRAIALSYLRPMMLAEEES